MKNNSFFLDKIDAFIFDFDGVLTNNCVFIDQNGIESVMCSRADGIAFEVLKKLNKFTCIISTEKNPVVVKRAGKLKVQALVGVDNKVDALVKLIDEKKYDISRVLYVGNDLNDYNVMKLCSLSACPSDSHPDIKNIAKIVLKSKGGSGVVRELLESVLNVDIVKVLYS
jgi:YrbI family 3-deoxy-D-manno-octulosonate 8-phosphate phosphatase